MNALLFLRFLNRYKSSLFIDGGEDLLLLLVHRTIFILKFHKAKQRITSIREHFTHTIGLASLCKRNRDTGPHLYIDIRIRIILALAVLFVMWVYPFFFFFRTRTDIGQMRYRLPAVPLFEIFVYTTTIYWYWSGLHNFMEQDSFI